MMTNIIIVRCGATCADLVQDIQTRTGNRPQIEKLKANDPRGSYGEYLVMIDSEDHEILTRCNFLHFSRSGEMVSI